MGARAAGARTLLSLVAGARRRAVLRRAVLELDASAVLPLIAAWALSSRRILKVRPSSRPRPQASFHVRLELAPVDRQGASTCARA